MAEMSGTLESPDTSIELVAERRWRASVKGREIGMFPLRSEGEQAVIRHLARRGRDRAIVGYGALLVVALGLVIAGFVLLGVWGFVTLALGFYGVARAARGIESALTGSAWAYREEADIDLSATGWRWNKDTFKP